MPDYPLKSHISLLAAVFLIIGTANQARSATYDSKKLRNLDFGVFCAHVPMDRIYAPNTVEGWIHSPKRAKKFHWKTKTVPAGKSIAFGVSASARGSGMSGAEIVVTHPIIKGRKTDRWKTRFRSGILTFDFYSFQHAYEMKPGNWRFQAIKDDKVLYDVRFKVVRASASNKIVKACARG